MHFRIRKNVIQFVRTAYNQETKKPKAMVVGSIPLGKAIISDELRAKLSDEEIIQAETWIKHQHHTTLLKEELGALTLADTLTLATNWFARQGDTEAARIAAVDILPALQLLRKTLNKL
ncbi:MAG: hypothetical protein QX199_00090 [Methylococcaceae bacterium]